MKLMKPFLAIIGGMIGLGGLIFTSFFTPKFEDVRRNTAEKAHSERVKDPRAAKAKVSAPQVGKKGRPYKKGSKEDKKAQSERVKLVQNRRKENG